jgi:DNA-binding NtrC family response regulator
MLQKVLVIEHAGSPLHGDWNALLRGSGFTVGQRIFWNNFDPGQLEDYPGHLVIASAAPNGRDALQLFAWLRRNPLRNRTLAILPPGDHEVFQASIGVTGDFIIAPIREEELRQRLARLSDRGTYSSEEIRSTLVREMGLRQMVGKDPTFLTALSQVAAFASSTAPVLLTGETGTGKELCARVIHLLGKHPAGPFIPVDCGSMPDHLFENELFGHSRGAFTDARTDHRGLISLAQGGTLLIDEIDSLSLVAQAKVLRLLQERTYRPLGSESFKDADVRVIAATNADLELLVERKLFRADLFFRINVLRLRLPPLRERRNDIPLLANHFIETLSNEADLPVKSLSRDAIVKLQLHHDWPGNVRELHNVLQRAVLKSSGPEITAAQLELSSSRKTESQAGTDFRSAKVEAVERFEREYVTTLLEKHGNNITRAAREAGKERRAFGRLVKKHRIFMEQNSGSD